MLASTRIAVIGLGLMGGSLALALRGKCARLTGVDLEPRAAEYAVQRGIVDRAATELSEGVEGADLIVLAVPVRASLSLLRQLGEFVQWPAAVMDLGSTKRDIVRAMANLPAHFDPLGGHPMCGKEHAGIEHAEAGLFRGAAFALTPLPRTSSRLKGLAEELVSGIGARPLFIDAEQHDRAAAAVSHLPYVVSSALIQTADGMHDPSVWELAGPGFRDSTRLAASDLTMMLDILATNRDAILPLLASLQSHLASLAGPLKAGDDATLAIMLRAGRERRARLFQPVELESPREHNLWPGA